MTYQLTRDKALEILRDKLDDAETISSECGPWRTKKELVKGRYLPDWWDEIRAFFDFTLEELI